ncbi:helix-turn-helix domain-containing protein [Vagococcus intermedius]|uniref:DUF4115 domain-containing protein n=1 Tax=Vagococcus intermedius TaxID=2991418 RepID=A0AAF0I7Z6_9ENTE|nr:helix-turn-helix domain-containing protein [Vagococcus intermedius]WEG73426.1 DUF4115 domain-containing protein [Vagococcus intermedius]WEG75509.1 DUF4115 domain-containing protein [Vagococcus intermedius]
MKSIGEILKSARLTRGLTIEELQQTTKIQKRYLEAIEANDFDALPSVYYAKSFIRQYATEVGADAEYLIARFEGKPTEAIVTPESVEGTRADIHTEKNNSKLTFIMDNLPMILLTVAAIVIISGIGFITLREGNKKEMIKKPKEVQVDKQAAPASKSKEKQADDKPSEDNKEQTDMSLEFLSQEGYDVNMAANNISDPVTLDLTSINDRCWIGIKVGDEYIFDQTLEANSTDSVVLPEGTTSVAITLGNLSNAQIKVNGQDLDFNPDGAAQLKRNVNLDINLAE